MNTSAIEVLGVVAIAMMVISYALEQRNRVFITIFAVGCALAAVYAYLIESTRFLSPRVFGPSSRSNDGLP